MASLPQSRGREPQARECHAAVASNRHMLVWAGYGGRVRIGTSIVENFDVLSASWRETRQLSQYLPEGLNRMAVAWDKEKAYTFGGNTECGPISDVYEVDLTSLVCKKIVPSADSAPSPSARCGSAMICCRRRLISYGGLTDGGQSDELHMFDLDTNTWTAHDTTGKKPPALNGHSLNIIDQHRALLFGGFDGYHNHNITYLLDIDTWQWSKVRTSGKKPPARAGHAACVIDSTITGHHPLLMVVGGLGYGCTVLSYVWFLDVTDGSWSEVSLPTDITGQCGHSAVAFGTGPDFRVVVLFGGNSFGNLLSETTLLLLGRRRGSWVVDRVVTPCVQGDIDDDVREQLRRLQISPSTQGDIGGMAPRREVHIHQQVEEATMRSVQAEARARDAEEIAAAANDRVRELEGNMVELQDQLRASETRVRERGEELVAERENRQIAEMRASDVQRQTNNRVRELEGRLVELQEQLREYEVRVREEGEELLAERENRQIAERRASEVERRSAGLERTLREEEGRRHLAEERVREIEERVRRATERQREAEGRMIEAENTKRQAEERQGDFERRVIENEQLVYRRLQQAEQRERESTSRAQLAENRLSQETQRRFETEQLNIHVEERLREAETVANALQSNTLEQHDEVFWRVERNEIDLSERELGRGGWAAVKVAEFRGLQVAAKCLHAIIISDHNRQLFVREMNIAAKLRHHHLVQFIGATLENEPIILTELMATSLRDVLGRGHLELRQITSISRRVALALNYMHQIRPDPILHRDVSSANVLLNSGPNDTWMAKLSDYGSANFTRQVRTAGPGNPSYAAPEASNPSQQSPKMDVYSFGVMLIEMATGRFPDRDALALQMRGITETRMAQLVRRCIDDNPTRRPTISAVITEL